MKPVILQMGFLQVAGTCGEQFAGIYPAPYKTDCPTLSVGAFIIYLSMVSSQAIGRFLVPDVGEFFGLIQLGFSDHLHHLSPTGVNGG